jgi:hypothetical protein
MFFPLSTRIDMNSLALNAADRNELMHETRKNRCGRKIAYRKNVMPMCIKSGYLQSHARRNAIVRKYLSVLMASFSINDTMIGKEIDDLSRANKEKNICRESNCSVKNDLLNPMM